MTTVAYTSRGRYGGAYGISSSADGGFFALAPIVALPLAIVAIS
ncbi:hypothetical protein [Frondihabitans sucicola]|nr:hypothetical protein [Frondihabitans sucicola]